VHRDRRRHRKIREDKEKQGEKKMNDFWKRERRYRLALFDINAEYKLESMGEERLAKLVNRIKSDSLLGMQRWPAETVASVIADLHSLQDGTKQLLRDIRSGSKNVSPELEKYVEKLYSDVSLSIERETEWEKEYKRRLVESYERQQEENLRNGVMAELETAVAGKEGPPKEIGEGEIEELTDDEMDR
jgi:hypothetical protein